MIAGWSSTTRRETPVALASACSGLSAGSPVATRRFIRKSLRPSVRMSLIETLGFFVTISAMLSSTCRTLAGVLARIVASRFIERISLNSPNMDPAVSISVRVRPSRTTSSVPLSRIQNPLPSSPSGRTTSPASYSAALIMVLVRLRC